MIEVMKSLVDEWCAQHLVGHHHLDELLVVDLAITIDISLADHLIDLLVGELLAEVCHDVAELGGGDETIAVLVEDLERLLDLLLGVGVLHLARHHGQELGEVDGAIAISVNLVDHVLQLSLGGVLSQRPHDGSELLGGDRAIAILVEEGERLLELGNLLVGKLGFLSHFSAEQETEREKNDARSDLYIAKSRGVGANEVSLFSHTTHPTQRDPFNAHTKQKRHAFACTSTTPQLM